jgi:MoxR-like ATPase
LATQNPIEQEGTYPLPEAQLDRFMFSIDVNYPDEAEERRIARETTGRQRAEPEPVLNEREILFYQDLIRTVPVPEHLVDYVVRFVRATRPGSESAPDWIRSYVEWGAGPRAVQNLIVGAKAASAVRGRFSVSKEDIDALLTPVLRHRLSLTFTAESQGMSACQLLERLKDEIR